MRLNCTYVSTRSKLALSSSAITITSCTAMAGDGTPCAFFQPRKRSGRQSSPIAIATRGPTHVIALIAETSPRQISPAMRCPPAGPKM